MCAWSVQYHCFYVLASTCATYIEHVSVIWTNTGNQQKHSWHINTELSNYKYNEVSSASLTVSMALNTGHIKGLPTDNL